MTGGWGCPGCGHAKAGHDERGCPGCDCRWRFVSDPLPAAGPTGEGRAEVREQVARAIGAEMDGLTPPLDDDDWSYLFREDEREDCYGLADAVLAVPAIREALELRQRVEAVAARFETARIDDPIAAWVGRTFAEHLRRALAGQDGDRQEAAPRPGGVAAGRAGERHRRPRIATERPRSDEPPVDRLLTPATPKPNNVTGRNEDE